MISVSGHNINHHSPPSACNINILTPAGLACIDKVVTKLELRLMIFISPGLLVNQTPSKPWLYNVGGAMGETPTPEDFRQDFSICLMAGPGLTPDWMFDVFH